MGCTVVPHQVEGEQDCGTLEALAKKRGPKADPKQAEFDWLSRLLRNLSSSRRTRPGVRSRGHAPRSSHSRGGHDVCARVRTGRQRILHVLGRATAGHQQRGEFKLELRQLRHQWDRYQHEHRECGWVG
jgi:hypothetical protein